MRKFALVVALVSATLTAEAATVGGVSLSDTTTSGGQTLALHGAEVRTKLFTKVYTAALHLPSWQASPERILPADTARPLVMPFVFDSNKEKIAEAWSKGLDSYTPGTTPA